MSMGQYISYILDENYYTNKQLWSLKNGTEIDKRTEMLITTGNKEDMIENKS